MLDFRYALVRDAIRLAEFAERTFRDTFGDQNHPLDMELYCASTFGVAKQLDEITDPSITTLLCETRDDLVGYLQLKMNEEKGDGRLEIQRLYVDKSWHGKEVGKLLIDKAFEIAIGAGAKEVWLGVWEHNTRAIRFYEKIGFTEQGEHTFQLGNDAQRDLVMVKPLA